MGRLIFFGSNCIDYYKNLNGGTPFAGGGPVNMAVRAAKLGADAVYIGAVGSDDYGRLIIRRLKENGVDTSRVRILEGKTAFCEVEMEGTERLLGDYDEGVLNDFELSDEDLAFMAEGDICAMDLWGDQASAFPRLKRSGVKTAFDCADRTSDPVSMSVLPYADYVFFSADEDSDDVRRQMREIYQSGPAAVIATVGAQGSVAYDADGFHVCSAAEVPDVVDTMGAGDSYIGGFLCAAAAGKSVDECMKTASRAAAEVLGFHGAFAQED